MPKKRAQPTPNAAYRRRQKQLACLCEHWPELFSQPPKKALKEGIFEDLLATKTVLAKDLKPPLAHYTRQLAYQRLLAAGGQRYDRSGQPVAEISAVHRLQAKQVLQTYRLRQAKKRQHHQGKSKGLKG